MSTSRLLALALLLVAGPASAQTWQPRPGAPAVDLHRHQADQHRAEMDRLRARADQREDLARQLQLETRLNRLEIQAARQPEPRQPMALPALRSPEQARAAREAATRRREATAAGIGQIDAWLDDAAQ